MTTPNVEYNKIHALARARKVVMQKFGPDLLHFWPMADDTPFIRDLLRKKVLVGQGGIIPQAPGMLDYGIDLGPTGYIADETADVGDDGSGDDTSYGYPMAVALPIGLWRTIKFKHTSVSAITCYVGAPEIPNGDLADEALVEVESSYQGSNLHEVTLPYDLPVATDGGLWFYVPTTSPRLQSSLSPQLTQYRWDSGASEWQLKDDARWKLQLYGVPGDAWPSLNSLTIGAVVNIDNTPGFGVGGGFVVTLQDSSEGKVFIRVKSSRKIEGYFMNTNGSTYTVTSLKPLHPGHNLVILSYERIVGVKLSVNGEVVATDTPSDHPLLDTTLALNIGAARNQGLGVGDATSKLTNGIVDDVWIAKGVVSDAALWDIYTSYITAAPLMQVEELIQVEA